MTRLTPTEHQEQAIQAIVSEQSRAALNGSDLGTGKCIAPGCDNSAARGRKECSGHRARIKRNGSYGDSPIKKVPPRHLSGWDIVEWNGWTETKGMCWEYRGPKFANGYGQVKVDGVPKLVHRLSYETFNGDIEHGKVIRHKCDNKICLNPDHLEVGTAKDNVDDRTIRGRTAYGERGGNSKLTDQDAMSIREELSSCLNRKEVGIKYRELSNKFNVSYSCIQRVWLRSTFNHLPGGSKWGS